ncbi:MAG: phosphatase PAP2 family protein [Bacilli bacterium]|nr:phosphatase PAP2 family protein [Bacilli bacterium]
MKKRYIIASIFFLLFILITILMITNNIKSFDNDVYNYIFSFRNNLLDNIFKTITKFGNTLTVIIMVFILLIFLCKENIYKLVLIVGTTVLTNQALKHIIRRIRPDHLRLIKEKGYSYPSGHSMISVAIYGLLIYLVYKNIKNKYLKIVLIILLLALILGIGISRVYLGVHYPSDVLAGFTITIPIIVLIICSIDDHFRGNINDKDSSK